LEQKQNTNTSIKQARIDSKMSNEEMEADINDFIKKLEDPNSYADMDYKEAFDYVEATLNYKYVNYDYSKCAKTKTFTSSVNINTNANGEITMADIKAAYDVILADWHNKYYSIAEEVKTPIVFDITEVTPNSVKYTMVVGYGYIDLSKWGDAFVPPSSTYFKTAAAQYTNMLHAHLNNNQIQWNPPGTRAYSYYITTVYVGPTQYPSNPSTASVNPEPLPPLGNFYTDYKLFKSDKSTYGNTNYHTYLNSTEYNYHRDMLSIIYLNELSKNQYANFVSNVIVEAYGINPYYYNINHHMIISLGHRYYTYTPISTL